MSKHGDLLHLVRMDGPMTEAEILDELPFYRWPADSLDKALGSLADVKKVKRRVNGNEFEDVWVARPRGIGLTTNRERVAVLHMPHGEAPQLRRERV